MKEMLRLQKMPGYYKDMEYTSKIRCIKIETR